MSETVAIAVQTHAALCEEVLALLARENRNLQTSGESQFEVCQARKALLPKLDASLRELRRHSAEWRSLPPEQRTRSGTVLQMIRQTQAAIMKALALDRENEQCLLRRGLMPARQIPPASRQRPHFVADLYRKNRLASA